MRRLTRAALGLGLLIGAAAQASTTFIDFNSDPVAAGLVTSITGTGPNGGQWIPYSGIGYVTNASDGFLQITAAVDGQSGKVIFPDFDNGQVVQGFNFDCYVRIGNGTNGTTPADGFSINYARANDPVLTGGDFAQGPDGELNMPEEGTQTGISIGFDAYANGGNPPFPPDQLTNIGPDTVALDVRVDGLLILQSPMPTLNGDVTNALSLQTGPNDGTGSRDSLGWAHLVVNLDTNGVLNVYYKGAQILTNYSTGYVPGPGRLVLAGRTGGLDQYQDVDDITITTTIAQKVIAGTAATGLGDGVSVPFFDSGAGVVNINAAATMILDGVSTNAPTAIAKNGGTTTLFYYGYPNFLVPGSVHTVVASVTDVFGRVITTSSLSFTVQPYSIVDSANQVTGVNTGTPGFRLLPWQSGAEPNDNWWAKEQLAGLQDTNNAYLTLATDNGYIDFTDVLNFNNNPAAIGGTDAGNFTSANGYGDGLFPGLPGPNGLNGSTALEVLAFLQFANPGVYTMGVNSDDGFDLTVGPNPADWGAFSLGQFNGGRGSADTIFTFVVTNTSGFYPVCLTWENGNGELPGNGANLEWFVVHNGVKMLVNDPSPTNTSGVKVYYGGPTLPAYVSDLRPNPDRTTFRPDEFIGMITDLGTTVTGTPMLFLDGAQFTSAVVSQANGVTTVSAPPGFLFKVGAHSAKLVYSTSGGGPFTNAWNFTVGNYFLAAWAVPSTSVDTTQPGFRLKPFQSYVWPNSYGAQPNDNRYTLEQLSGLHGPNAANLTTATDGGFIDYVADPSGTPNGTINFIINPPGTAGNFPNKTGFPGLTLGTDIPDIGDESIDVLCFLQFSAAGVYTMGVNSDDGFAVFGGANPSDWFTGALFGQFSGGRGPGDTTFSVFVPVAGIYPVRMFWENGNGSASGGNGAACEWFVVQPDGTKVLLNDTNVDTGVKAFFKGPALPAYVSAFCPAAGATGVSQYPAAAGLSTSAFGVQLTDGSTTVTPGSIEVFINGTAMTPVVSQSSGTPKVTTVTLPANNPLVPGTNYAQFVYSTSGGGPFTNAWGFTVATNTLPVVNSAWAVTGVNPANKGFRYRPWQSGTQPNTVWWTEEQLVGLHGPNNANLSILNDGAYFDYTGIVNFDIGTSHDGDFIPRTQFYPNYPDINFPGIPGANNVTDNSAIEMLAWIQFNQAGVYTMCVNSDDGFKVTVGPNPADWFALNLGQYNGGRGAGANAGTTFSFVITAPGFYPVRLIWENGTGGCNVEWTMVQPDGARILINDPNAPENTQVTAYYSGPAAPASVRSVEPTPGATDGLGSLVATLADNGTPITSGSVQLYINGVAVTPTIGYANGITSVTYDGLVVGTNNATLVYSTSAGGPFTNTWQFFTATSSTTPVNGITLSTNLWTPPGSGSNPGFAIKVFQSPNTNILNGWQNITRMADMAIHDWYGPSVADLTDYTNNGAMWWPGVINFSQNSAATLTDNGNFRNTTYPDSVISGLGVWDPTAVGLTQAKMDNDCMEVKAFLEFSAPGYYVMGVNSDDGFRVTVGDQGAPGTGPVAILAPAASAGEIGGMYTTTADEGGNNTFGVTPPSTVPMIGRAVLCDPINTSSATLNNASAMAGNIAVSIHSGNLEGQARKAFAAGAIAVINGHNPGDSPSSQYPGTRGGDGGTAVPIPCINITYAAFQQLTNSITSDVTSPVIVRITAQDCSPIAGKIDNGKGSSDVLFGFTVPQAGVYPFRLIWENGGGDANCEWFVRDLVSGDYLVNAPSSPVKAWITRDVHAAGALPAPKLNDPIISGGNVTISWTGAGELWESYSLNGPWFKSTYQANPSTVVQNPFLPERFFRVRQY